MAEEEVMAEVKAVREERRRRTKHSALDIAGIDLGVSTKEIVEFVREGRERS